MNKVRCNWCMEVFDEDKIIDDGETEFCPFCNRGGCLMDMEREEIDTIDTVDTVDTVDSSIK